MALEYRAFASRFRISGGAILLCGFWSCLSRRVLGDMVVFARFLLLGRPCAVYLVRGDGESCYLCAWGNYSVRHTLGGSESENKSSPGISLVGALKALFKEMSPHHRVVWYWSQVLRDGTPP